MKHYTLTSNIGAVKYVISYHDGIKKHEDGSYFYDIATFKNKQKMNEFIKELIADGYREVIVTHI